MIWKIADPHTTKMNSASSHGPTGYFSSAFFVDLGTFPRWVMLRLAFSLAMRILCWGAIVLCVGLDGVRAKLLEQDEKMAIGARSEKETTVLCTPVPMK